MAARSKSWVGMCATAIRASLEFPVVKIRESPWRNGSRMIVLALALFMTQFSTLAVFIDPQIIPRHVTLAIPFIVSILRVFFLLSIFKFFETGEPVVSGGFVRKDVGAVIILGILTLLLEIPANIFNMIAPVAVGFPWSILLGWLISAPAFILSLAALNLACYSEGLRGSLKTIFRCIRSEPSWFAGFFLFLTFGVLGIGMIYSVLILSLMLVLAVLYMFIKGLGALAIVLLAPLVVSIIVLGLTGVVLSTTMLMFNYFKEWVNVCGPKKTKVDNKGSKSLLIVCAIVLAVLVLLGLWVAAFLYGPELFPSSFD